MIDEQKEPEEPVVDPEPTQDDTPDQPDQSDTPDQKDQVDNPDNTSDDQKKEEVIDPNDPDLKSLLADPEDGEKKEGEEEGEKDDTPPPTEEEVKKFTDGLKSLDLGDGVRWDNEAVKAMTPSLMKISKGDPRKADDVIRAYTKYQLDEQKKINNANNAYIKQLTQECRTRFGKDVGKFATEAKTAGKEIFGDKLWNVLSHIPQVANDPDVIERLAGLGRRLKTDTPPVEKEPPKKADSPDDWRSMYDGIK